MSNILPPEAVKKVNDYNQDMKYADSASVRGKLDRFMRSKLHKFWNIESIFPIKEKKLQFAGVDSIIKIHGQQPIRVEEKVRRLTRKDILVELIADNRYYLKGHRGLGWGLKNYTTDLLVYFFEDTQTGFIFHWEKFQKALIQNLPEWYDLAKKEQYGFSLKKAQNKKYYSLNIVIPQNAMLHAYKNAGGIII